MHMHIKQIYKVYVDFSDRNVIDALAVGNEKNMQCYIFMSPIRMPFTIKFAFRKNRKINISTHYKYLTILKKKLKKARNRIFKLLKNEVS